MFWIAELGNYNWYFLNPIRRTTTLVCNQHLFIYTTDPREPEILYFWHPKDRLEKKGTTTEYGHWEFYKCSCQNRYVSCGVDNSLLRQLRPEQTLVHHHQSEKESKEIIPTMSQTLLQFLPMAGSSLWQSVTRFGDGTKLFLRIKDYKSYLLWVIIDFLGYPHPF